MPYFEQKAGTLVAALLLAMVEVPAVAEAAAATAGMAVSATVLDLCSVAAAPLSFGEYDGSQLDATAKLSVTCTRGTPFHIGLSVGTGAGASARVMTGPNAKTLRYQVYTNAGRTTVWGEVIGTDTVGGTGSGDSQTFAAYGRIPAGQFPSAGQYTDAVTVTITY